MWFLKLCLYVIAANACRLTGNHSAGLILSFAYILEVIKDVFIGGNND